MAVGADSSCALVPAGGSFKFVVLVWGKLVFPEVSAAVFVSEGFAEVGVGVVEGGEGFVGGFGEVWFCAFRCSQDRGAFA